MNTENNSTTNELSWQQLLPPADLIDSNYLIEKNQLFLTTQVRFDSALTLFFHSQFKKQILLVASEESQAHFDMIETLIKEYINENHSILKQSLDNDDDFDEDDKLNEDKNHIGTLNKNTPVEIDSTSLVSFKGEYIEKAGEFIFDKSIEGKFSASKQLICESWTEFNQLFGTVRVFKDKIQLSPGLLHQVNGGVLVLSANTILAQPLIWFRLLKIIQTGTYEWSSLNDTKPYPVSIANMPMHIRLVIVGNRDNLSMLEEMSSDLHYISTYTEYEDIRIFEELSSFQKWQNFVGKLADTIAQLKIDHTSWPILYRHSTRYTGDHAYLSLCPQFWTSFLQELKPFAYDGIINDSVLDEWYDAKIFTANYLAERVYDDFNKGQILIEVEGEAIGQVNGLAVLNYPGHPVAIGEPSRITCIVHLGDGEVNDIERKVELAGNIHAKGLLIMQAFLLSELSLNQQFPFTASIVFEQSYSEVDGDSASLAELCALISALAEVPINQQIALTGSVDQFGNVQPIGGVNEKIEGFFAICEQSGLTGNQGVIIPSTNSSHLCLNDDVIEAVKEGQFHIWTVDHVREAIELLTRVKYKTEDDNLDLMTLMQKNILLNSDSTPSLPWYKRLFGAS